MSASDVAWMIAAFWVGTLLLPTVVMFVSVAALSVYDWIRNR